MRKPYALRKGFSMLMAALTVISAGVSAAVLLILLIYVLRQGAAAIDLDFFTRNPLPVGEPGGGIANAIVGSFVVVGLAALFALPIGIGSGIYLSEFGRNRFGDIVRFLADVLSGVPSIIMGLFAYVVVVAQQKHFSALSGGFALGVMMLPIVTRTTEEMLRMVPDSVREAGLALGIPRWRVLVHAVIPAASRGILTGVVLALARVAGETAPLLFTAFGNPYFSLDINQPIATLPHTLFTYAISPYDDWRLMAWGTALVLTALIFIASLLIRAIGETHYEI
ncbi:MAG TPA: phosphate ABC transporter permease PstA [Anaerolineae bacterium]|nr:phosphate ABC transporter permease PstA [Anaerolineae bacterium]